MKSLFNFYLDDRDKELAIKKLNDLCGEQNKGQLAAFLRVSVNMFLNTPNEHLQTMKQLISEEYVYSARKNKRSNL